MEPVRVTPEAIRPKIQSGQALLVCAYKEDGKFNAMHLEGAISLAEFQTRLPSLPKEQEIVFYCA